MDIKDLKLLIKLVTETDITEFEMDNSDEKIINQPSSSTLLPDISPLRPLHPLLQLLHRSLLPLKPVIRSILRLSELFTQLPVLRLLPTSP